MVITFQGDDSFKVSQGELSLVINPKSKISADITLFNVGHEETSDKSGFVISGPGEYEIKDISVKGLLSYTNDKKINTVYVLNFEGVNLCFLGSLTDSELSSETLGQLEDIDILFAPVSNYKLAVSLEPAIIIPTSYTPETLKKFLKETGEDDIKPLDKLVVKKKDLDGKEGEIVVLKEE
ncbi:MAG: MBL fold metallo-hydrolase [Patescibacteria group bacterium]